MLSTAAPGSAREKLTMGDTVFMIGSDGKAKKGKITAISRDNFGKVNPVVQWNGSSDKVRIPFLSLKKDSHPQSNPNPQTPKNDDKGPAPMDIDAKAAGKGKGKLVCNNCRGTGHFARECPSKSYSGHEAHIEEVEEEEEVDESGKGDA
jgi:hypothetical protein